MYFFLHLPKPASSCPSLFGRRRLSCLPILSHKRPDKFCHRLTFCVTKTILPGPCPIAKPCEFNMLRMAHGLLFIRNQRPLAGRIKLGLDNADRGAGQLLFADPSVCVIIGHLETGEPTLIPSSTPSPSAGPGGSFFTKGCLSQNQNYLPPASYCREKNSKGLHQLREGQSLILREILLQNFEVGPGISR